MALTHLEPGTFHMARPDYLRRLVVLAPEARSLEVRVDLDAMMGSAQHAFQASLKKLRASARWTRVHAESGRTAGYRFAYLVLRPAQATEEGEAVVGAVVIAPAEPLPVGGRYRVTADVSGEESGTIYHEAPPCEVTADRLGEEVVRAAEKILGWLEGGMPEHQR